jgi:prolipoprotein diacylglyceryl transferase
MIHWNVDPVIFDLGIIAPRWYGLLFASAFMASYYVMRFIFERERRPLQDLDSLTLYMILGTVLGARAGHMLFYEPDVLLQNPFEFIAIWKGGLASHGGALGIIAGLMLFGRTRRKYTFVWLMDRLAIVAALSGMFIRLGNLMNSEIIGKPTDVAWAFWFQRIDPTPVFRHPTQIYEAVVCLILFVLLMLMYRRGYGERSPGSIIGVFLAMLFSARFAIEFLKERQVDFEASLPLDMGQILSIPFVLWGFWFLWHSRKQTA